MLQAAQSPAHLLDKNDGHKVQSQKLDLSISAEPSIASAKLSQTPQPTPATETKPAVEKEAPIKPSPPPLLILDLNGCLLYREYQPGHPRIIHPRPHLKELFQYALSPPVDQGKHDSTNHKQNWEIMIWSSAQSKNVEMMCQAIDVTKRVTLPNRNRRAKQAPHQLEDISNRLDSLSIDQSKDQGAQASDPLPRRVLDVWDRSQLDLSSADYNRKVSTTKDLRKVWDGLTWTDPESGEELKWGAHNTVIVDDSPDKLSLQPGNLCMINEFSGDSSDKSLLELIEKLKVLRNAADIPEAIKKLNEKGASA
ncbi:hypothetical protein PCANC_24659 [Puccinia coronata f. sp. avenae]|uniref:Mitochondrial import inner membrane translocase subunit TIM50 n=1 Tax=Puccinia coronata f. sp. avenae TaxID=200324 RepID=A0A2N5TZB8_9BASI|nr:hypothetical protein PCANC_24659 [Puccinia coronata f. sp. avenae]PLW51957.1 hypothetical protein PCASD_00786 [Puccinia coronata f. sp. avenae]